MTTKIKFPYTMHCPKCRTGLKIKSPKLIGTKINCPKCKKRIDVVTPEEDAMNPYGIEAPPEPEKLPEPTEEEIAQEELEKKRKKRMEILRQVWFWTVCLFILVLIGVLGWLIYEYAIVPFSSDKFHKESAPLERPAEFQ